MQDSPILDDFGQNVSPSAKEEVWKIFLFIELGLWGLCGLEFLFWNFYSRAFLLEIPVFPYRLLPAFSLLSLFYLVCPIWLFGSVGWRRHIGSHLAGLVIAFGTLSFFLRVDNVFYDSKIAEKGTIDICVAAINICFEFFLLTALTFLIRRYSPRGKQFFWAVLARLGFVLVLLAFSIWVVGH